MLRRLLGPAVVLLLLLVSSPAWAGTIAVTTTADSGAGSLRQALATAGAGDTVTVPAGTYVLTSGVLPVAAGVTLQGAGARLTTLSGNHASGVLQVTGAGVTVADLTVTAGRAADGAGINATNGLTLQRVAIVSNVATSDAGGLDVLGTQPLLIDHTLIASNQVTSASGDAGGIDIETSSPATAIVDSTIAGNSAGDAGGGFYVEDGTTLLDGDTIVGNTLSGSAGQGGNFRLHDNVITIHDTVLAGGVAAAGGDCYLASGVTLTSLGHNAEDVPLNPDSDCQAAFRGPGDRTGLTLALGSLQDNGGPTDTMLPAATSPLLDLGDPVGCLADDQRGVVRPQGSGCDVGAVERSSATIAGSFADGLTSATATLHGTVSTAGLGGSARFAYGPTAAYGAFADAPALAPTAAAQGASAQLTGLLPVTTYHFRLEVTTPDGTVDGPDTVLTTPATPVVPPPPAILPLAPAVTAPVLGTVKQTASRWRAGTALARVSSAKKRKKAKQPPVGTTFSFTLDRAATVTFSFARKASGRKAGRVCVAPGAKNRRARSCTRTVVQLLSVAGHKGANRVRFDGRLDKHHALVAGSYTASITATAAGKRSKAATLRFTIVRG